LRTVLTDFRVALLLFFVPFAACFFRFFATSHALSNP